MKERPILFSGPMVLAILEGRKTQTRRVVKLPKKASPLAEFHHIDFLGNAVFTDGSIVRCQYGTPGDGLWVKETWGSHNGSDVIYRADPRSDNQQIATWRPSIHMPRWASRITLEVVSVRVERLQDISEEDARAEGAFFTDYGRTCNHTWDGPEPCPAPPEHHQQKNGWAIEGTSSADQCLGSARMAFANLWQRINGHGVRKVLRDGTVQKHSPKRHVPDYSWDANPWVWVVEFKQINQ